ncbi:hypothetical protein FOCC_FOCC016955 [Frankliniella occidentalis]|nr:hypothetical protein FOCC_FOCC016955 [Frankliniella occidentalis]
MLMSLQYRVTLPDHDFPVGTRHNLTPSVMAVIAIKEDQLGKPEAVTYSGPTYICVRSGKHASSTANTHADDFRRMVDLPEFQEFTKTPDGRVKPVVMMTVDGGPDECPRGETEDLELEKQNFKKAGEILVGLWSDMTIDDYPVHAVYIEPGESDLPPDVDPQWYHDHVRESQYLVQIMRRRGTEALCWVQYDHESRDAEWIEEDHIDLDILNNDVIESEDSPMPVVHSVGEWVSSPWTKDL